MIVTNGRITGVFGERGLWILMNLDVSCVGKRSKTMYVVSGFPFLARILTVTRVNSNDVYLVELLEPGLVLFNVYVSEHYL